MNVDLEEYVSAGYYVTSYVPRPSYVAQSLPDKIVSGSDCLCVFVPDIWTLDPRTQRQEEKARTLGVRPADLDRLEQWTHQRMTADEIGWPNVIFSVTTARELVHDFLAASRDAVILGLGLHDSFLDVFSAEKRTPTSDGLSVAIQRQERITPRGRILGFEPRVLFGTSLRCSWLCNHLERECQQSLGIVPNEHGFLATFEEATQCVQHISRDDVGSEPGYWLPWLVIKYA